MEYYILGFQIIVNDLLLLVVQVLKGLILRHVHCVYMLVVLVAPLLRQDVVLVLDDEVHVVAEVLVESMELRT